MGALLTRFFSQEDQEAVRKAVAEAERETSGEIVAYVVERSDTYEEAEWRGGAFFGSLVLIATALFHDVAADWPSPLVAGTLLGGVLAFGGGMLLVKFVAPLTRVFTGRGIMERRVAARAAEAFVSEEVFNTRDRTGVLIFVSVLEHLVLVVGDSGITSRVGTDAWSGLVNTVLNGIRAGKPAGGLIAAVREAGEILKQHGVAVRADDNNELRDDLRLNRR
jgi:putative membrane protein